MSPSRYYRPPHHLHRPAHVVRVHRPKFVQPRPGRRHAQRGGNDPSARSDTPHPLSPASARDYTCAPMGAGARASWGPRSFGSAFDPTHLDPTP